MLKAVRQSSPDFEGARDRNEYDRNCSRIPAEIRPLPTEGAGYCKGVDGLSPPRQNTVDEIKAACQARGIDPSDLIVEIRLFRDDDNNVSPRRCQS